jgi:hypothetical protein
MQRGYLLVICGGFSLFTGAISLLDIDLNSTQKEVQGLKTEIQLLENEVKYTKQLSLDKSIVDSNLAECVDNMKRLQHSVDVLLKNNTNKNKKK